jgi:hypothetical protein
MKKENSNSNRQKRGQALDAATITGCMIRYGSAHYRALNPS